MLVDVLVISIVAVIACYFCHGIVLCSILPVPASEKIDADCLNV